MPYYPSAEIDVEEVLRQTGVFKLLRLGDPVRLSDIPSWDSPTGRRIYEQVVSTPRDTPLTRRQRRLLPATTMSGRMLHRIRMRWL